MVDLEIKIRVVMSDEIQLKSLPNSAKDIAVEYSEMVAILTILDSKL